MVRSICVILFVVLAATYSFVGNESEHEVRAQERLDSWISRDAFTRAEPRHQAMLLALARQVMRPRVPAVACWAELPDDETVVDAFNAALVGGSNDFQLNSRWTSTALSGSVPLQGTPTVLTYSFVPDGTLVPSGTGEPVGNSNLLAVFNAAFGSQSTWQNLVHAAITNWGNSIGVTYVFEPNDDGAQMFSVAGLAGVRGDIRICGKTIDGAQGILAFNFFPNDGDMCIDTSDTAIFASPTNNYRAFRNTISHEHGHGLGILHVCPLVQTKLMEPILATAFDGPQFDDILGAQRHYGDRNESNDTAATATNLGTLSVGMTTVDQQSIDDDSDVDYFEFTLTSPADLSIVVRPNGMPYLQGPQVGQCNTGANFDPRFVADLEFDLLDPSGAAVLAHANSQPAGINETITNYPVLAAGTYYLRVDGDATNNIQTYSIDLNVGALTPPPFLISFPNGVPAKISPHGTAPVNVLTTGVASSSSPAGAMLFVSTNGGPFVASPLSSTGPDTFSGNLPQSPSFGTLRWYVTIVPITGGPAVPSPYGAPSNTYVTSVETDPLVAVFTDDFEANRGWTVTNSATLTGGAWERGTPIGGGTRGDPVTDGDGSGQCYVTQNVPGNSDVDDGATMLTSPVFDLTAYPGARMRCLVWFDNVFGANPGTDPLIVEMSNNGGTSWVPVETYGQSLGLWVEREYVVTDYVPLSSTVQIRFIAQDPAPGSVVEAGLDAFVVEACSPVGPSLPAAGTGNVGGILGPIDVLFLNGSSGGVDRRVDIARGQPIVLSVTQPPTAPVAAAFTLWGYFGTPSPSQTFALPLLVGNMCFTPCAVSPLAGTSFTLVDGFGFDPCPKLTTATTAPWSRSFAGLNFPFTVTIQGVILGDTFLRVTNGIILRVL